MLTAFAILALLCQSAPASSPALGPIRYRVGLDREANTWSVEMTIPLPKRAPFDLWIPRWTPGAYHTADFAQYVTDLSAADSAGNALRVTRNEPVISWTIDPGTADAVEVRYSAKAPSDGPLAPLLPLEASAISKSRASLTPCSLLAFVPQWKHRPVEVELALPEGWKAATALDRREDGVYMAPSYLRLEDSPILMGRRLETATFEASGARHEVATLGSKAAETEALAADCRKIVEAGSRMMGGVPYRRYVFLFGFGSGSGGLEHSDSTLILMPKGSSELRHVVAHEYFHAWNAERIHVEGIANLDQTRPFTTGTIWMNEGATEYVSGLLLVDAGLRTEEEFFGTLARNHAMVRSPMLRELLTKRSWLDVSRAFTHATADDLMELALTHYQEGSVVLFALDLEMRRASGGARGVPDLMRHLFEAYARKGRGYGEDELPSIIDRVAGADLSSFYDRYVAGKDMVDLSDHLDVIGMRLRDRAIADVEDPTPEQLAARRKLLAIAK